MYGKIFDEPTVNACLEDGIIESSEQLSEALSFALQERVAFVSMCLRIQNVYGPVLINVMHRPTWPELTLSPRAAVIRS